MASRSATRSHPSAKLVTSTSARGSFSMRATWLASTFGRASSPDSPSFSSSSSGPWLHKKKERRDASSSGLSSWFAAAASFAGAIERYRKSGLESTAVVMTSIPSLKPPAPLRPSSKNAMSRSTSGWLTGRRNARRARFDLGLADEQLLAALGLREARGIERPRHVDAAEHARHALPAREREAGARAVVG